MGTVNAILHNYNLENETDTFTIIDNVLQTTIASPTLQGGEEYQFQLEQDSAGWGDCTVISPNSKEPFGFHTVHDGDTLDVT